MSDQEKAGQERSDRRIRLLVARVEQDSDLRDVELSRLHHVAAAIDREITPARISDLLAVLRRDALKAGRSHGDLLRRDLVHELEETERMLERS